MPTFDNISSNRRSYMKFIESFANAHGSLQILIVSTLYSIGIGSVLGLVRPNTLTGHFFFPFSPCHSTKIPQTLTDRYARINHGFTDHCHHYVPKPPACIFGSEDAQSAAAWSHVGLSALLLLVNPIISSLSDIHGRKSAILLALLLSCIPAFVFYLIIVRPDMNPVWYYVSVAVEDLFFFNYNNFLIANGTIFLYVLNFIYFF